MIYYIYSFLYGERFIFTIVAVILFAFLMGIICTKARDKGQSMCRIMTIVTIAALALSLAAILYVTIIIRLPSDGIRSEIVVQPFSSLEAGLENPERFRIFAANILLCVPMGACLMGYQYLRGADKIVKAYVIVLILGMLMSIAIETTQYILALGYVELDDVICNTLGSAAGALLWINGKSVTFSIENRINK